MPHKKLKGEPKLVRTIEKRKSKVYSMTKNSSLVDCQPYIDNQEMDRSCSINDPEFLARNLDLTLKKSQTISYERRQTISPKCKGPRINYNLKLLIKSRRPSSISATKNYQDLVNVIRRM